MSQNNLSEFHYIDAPDAIDKDVMGINHFIGTEPRSVIPSLYIDENEIDKRNPKKVAPSKEIACWQYHDWDVEVKQRINPGDAELILLWILHHLLVVLAKSPEYKPM